MMRKIIDEISTENSIATRSLSHSYNVFMLQTEDGGGGGGIGNKINFGGGDGGDDGGDDDDYFGEDDDDDEEGDDGGFFRRRIALPEVRTDIQQKTSKSFYNSA
jgi:hypothetical protein